MAYKRTDWTTDMDSVLGTMTDQAAAQLLGVSRAAAMTRRRRLKKMAFRPRIINPRFMDDSATDNVVGLTAKLSAETRHKANQLRPHVAGVYRAAGLPVRAVPMWQVIEYAINQLYLAINPKDDQ